MKHIIFLFITGFLALNNCSSQDNKITDSQGNKVIEQGKSNSPQINSKVKKEYDENGNLKSFDSTYTYIYNSGKGNFPDSLPGLFSKHFNGRLFSGDSTLFGNLFNDDSFLKKFFDNNSFFKDPFRHDHMRSDTIDQHVPRIQSPDDQIFNSDRFRQMFKYLDSLDKVISKNFYENRNFDPEKFFKQKQL